VHGLRSIGLLLLTGTVLCLHAALYGGSVITSSCPFPATCLLAHHSQPYVHADDVDNAVCCAVSQSLRVDEDYKLIDNEDDPFASKFMSFEVFTSLTFNSLTLLLWLVGWLSGRTSVSDR